VADEQVASRADKVCWGWIVPTARAESILADAPNESVEGPELDIELPREVGVREDELLDLRRRHALRLEDKPGRRTPPSRSASFAPRRRTRPLPIRRRATPTQPITWRTGDQISSEKLRNPWTSPSMAVCFAGKSRSFTCRAAWGAGPGVAVSVTRRSAKPGEALSGLVRHFVEVPTVGNSLQLMLAGVIKGEAGARNEISHSLRDEDVVRAGLLHHASAD
jgi:hypothetical protein